VITIGILSLLTLSIAIGWVVARRRRRIAEERPTEIPLFTVPVSSLVSIPRPPADRLPTVPASASAGSFSQASPTIRTRDGEVSTLVRPSRDVSSALSENEFGEPVDGASIRYWRVADGTLQFLPGRLEIAAGRDAGHEIRFVRTAGPDGTCITFGRAEGAPYRHVQLREPTVSRAHARMALESANGGPLSITPSNAGPSRWRLENLSATNPVIVNGKALDPEGGPRASVILSEGDRIEMGEVAFVFRAR
jgi:FHA domain-containing protein